jgi:hypothetical protein
MTRRINDGDMTGIKQDRFRNSKFEYERNHDQDFGGVMRKTSNTLGGPFDENRGRRSATSEKTHWDNSPFENGRLSNWNRRQGWDEYYNQGYERGSRHHGGALLGHDAGHAGRGPRGYKRSDDSIYDDVCDTLTLSPDVDASDIEVSVKEGIVFLNGNVSDRQSKKMAELEIENVSGVMDVQNLLNFTERNKDLH